MVALTMQRLILETTPAVIFASGVADSTCQEQKYYNREHDLLKETISYSIKNYKILVYFYSAGAVYGNCDEPKNED